jgi:hypothetical protein
MLASKDLPNEMPAFEKWYLRYHAAEVIHKDGPWLTRFVAYRPLPVIPQALSYGYYNMRVIECWYRSVEERSGAEDMFRFTWQAPWAKKPVEWGKFIIPRVSINVAIPAPDIFLACKYSADEKTILRWYIVTKYPKGVTLQQGEDWFVNIHSKEVLKQPGLIGYFSSRAVQIPGYPPDAWVRLSELWYEDFNGWKESVIDSPPKYTRPSWTKYDKYPFLEPYVDFTSTFLAERPDIDYLKEARPFP